MNKIISILKTYINRNRRDLIWWAVLILAVPAVQLWQTRHLLAKRQLAPAFGLYDIGGKIHSLSEYRGKPVVIYFFAPWCTVCKATSSNVSSLRSLRDTRNLVVLAVGLSYSNREEIKNFAKDHGLNNVELPILLGDSSVEDNYRIGAYPTFYFIDANGQVASTSTGYTTTAGLLLRSL